MQMDAEAVIILNILQPKLILPGDCCIAPHLLTATTILNRTFLQNQHMVQASLAMNEANSEV